MSKYSDFMRIQGTEGSFLGSPTYRFKSRFLFESSPLLGGVMPKRKGGGPPSLVLDRVPGITSIHFLRVLGLYMQSGQKMDKVSH